MKNVVTWLSADIQARIKPPPIPIIKLEVDDERTTNIIKVKMRRNPSSAASKTYSINMNTFDYGQPEEFLPLLNNLKISTDGTGTTTPSGWVNYLHTMLQRKALREFNGLQSQYSGFTNSYLKFIQEGLLEYLFPINSLSKEKRVIRCAMRKP